MSRIVFSRSCFFAITVTVVLTFASLAPFAYSDDLNSTSKNNSPGSTSNLENLSQLSIEELTNLEVTSPSRRAEKFSDVSAALFVLTNDDIRRSGATSVAEVLRLVPGLNVMRIDGSQWAVSSRGLSEVYESKLLVLVDGRSVYTPLFAGVFWNELDLFLEDIERIEVIRGPGATLYGSNAVNGVINIITKHAKDTQGGYASVGGGSHERNFGEFRYGDSVGKTDYRAYAKYYYRNEDHLAGNGDAHDEWESVRTGFRSDTKLDNDNTFTVEGDAYYGESGWDILRNTPDQGHIPQQEVRYINGVDLVGRWNSKFSPTSDLSLQLYYDRIERDEVVILQERDTFDIDFQHRFELIENHNLLYGAEYRIYSDDIDGTATASVTPTSRTLNLLTGFVQDEITLIPEQLRLTVGTKVEYNDLSAVDVMPNVRLSYTPDTINTIWGAVSRAVRTPARFNNDGRLLVDVRQGLNKDPNQVVTLNGYNGFDSEKLLAYETGYRTKIGKQLSFDLAAFYFDYNDLISAEPAGSPFINSNDPFSSRPYVEVPYRVENKLKGYSTGGEVAIDWRPLKQWRLVPTYQYVYIDLKKKAGSQDIIYLAQEGQTPRNQAMLRSLLDLPYRTKFDATLRYVDPIPTFNIKTYFELDLRAAWNPFPDWELAVIGQNLLHNRHAEFASNLTDSQLTEIERSVYGKVTYRF